MNYQDCKWQICDSAILRYVRRLISAVLKTDTALQQKEALQEQEQRPPFPAPAHDATAICLESNGIYPLRN